MTKWCCQHFIGINNLKRKVKSRLLSFSPLWWTPWYYWWTFSYFKLHTQTTQFPKHIFYLLYIQAQAVCTKQRFPFPMLRVSTSLTNSHTGRPQRSPRSRHHWFLMLWMWLAISHMMGQLWSWTQLLAGWLSSWWLWSPQCLVGERGLGWSHSVAFSHWVF